MQQQQQQQQPLPAQGQQQPGLGAAVSLEMNQRRSLLLGAGFILIVAGCFSLVSCWAVYYFGIVLSVGSIITGFTQVSHTRTEMDMLHNNRVVQARTAFGTLQAMNIAGVILATIATICAAASLAIIAGCNSDYYCYISPAWTIFAVVALISSLTILVTAAFSAMKCGEMNRDMLVLFPAAPVLGAPSVVVMGGYQAMPVVAYAQPAYGQPVQPAPAAYGQPAPGYYAQPAPQQPAGYGQPLPQQGAPYQKTA